MANLVPLSRWLFQQPNQTVAVAKAVPETTQDFQNRVRGWMAALAVRPGTRWAVYHHDAYEFLSIVFALWQLGRTACVPGDNKPGSIQRLKPIVDGFAGEFEVDDVVSDGLRSFQTDHRWSVLESEFNALEIFTSGSSGEPAAIRKTLAQLELEVAALESLWPDETDAVVLATVSHQHLYGLTFRLFWPLSTGRAFERKTIEYTEDILYLSRLYASFSLVSSPSHLTRINTSVDWTELSDSCRYVLSSAAPLARVDSLNVSKIFNTRVREIYGSSETGAVAWRSQNDSSLDALWHPLPGVALSAEEGGRLAVMSPYLEDSARYILSDRVEFSEAGGFQLIGRVDRVVKVEGKRVSLAAMENILLEHVWVKNLRALTIERYRVETAVVIELSAEGREAAGSLTVKAMTGKFRAMLSEHFEAVVLPRRWRIVDRLPYNQQGKLPQDALRQLFAASPLKWPEITSQEWVENQLSMTCYIPPKLIYFEGHFPDNPILPGIVQVHWAEAYGRQFLSVTGYFYRLEVIKFQQVIPPETSVKLILAFDAKKAKLNFSYESDKGTHSSGRICFRNE